MDSLGRLCVVSGGSWVDGWGAAARGVDHGGRVSEGAGGGSDGVETSGDDGGLSPRLLKLSALVPCVDTLTFTNVRASLT